MLNLEILFFSGAIFENCQFVNGRHYDCCFRCQFYSSLFDEWQFDHCKINHLSSLFNNCQFNDFHRFCFDSSSKLISSKIFDKYVNE
jgi:hypothetical protein